MIIVLRQWCGHVWVDASQVQAVGFTPGGDRMPDSPTNWHGRLYLMSGQVIDVEDSPGDVMRKLGEHIAMWRRPWGDEGDGTEIGSVENPAGKEGDGGKVRE